MSEALLILVLSVFAVAIMTVATVGLINSEMKNEQVTCTTKKLANSSLVVCTYKDKVLFNGEINE